MKRKKLTKKELEKRVRRWEEVMLQDGNRYDIAIRVVLRRGWRFQDSGTNRLEATPKEAKQAVASAIFTGN